MAQGILKMNIYSTAKLHKLRDGGIKSFDVPWKYPGFGAWTRWLSSLMTLPAAPVLSGHEGHKSDKETDGVEAL